MSTSVQKVSYLLAALAAIGAGSRSDAAVFATYDAAQHNTNGFRYADFSDFFAVDTSAGVINIDVQTDVDASNGLFGGMGSDLVADFNANTTQLEVSLTVGPNNAANGFSVVLVDNDGVNTGEEYQYFFDLTGLTPGVPTTVTQSLVNPGPVYRQAAFNQADGDMVQNYGLRQMQIQSLFGNPNRLNILVNSVKLVDPGDPTLISFTSSTYNAQPGRFTYGTFGQAGVLNAAGSTMVINHNPAGAGGPDGGFGFGGLNIDFDATQYQIEIDAKLRPGNTAAAFNLLLGDNDGNDSGPGLGSEDFLFTVNTSQFNSSGFSTFTIPLGSGSQSGVVKTFGFTNAGDGLQNFDLSQMQIQAIGADPGVLAIEVSRFAIVQRPDADFNNDSSVDGADLLIWQRGLGVGTTNAQGDATRDSVVNGADLAAWKTAFGMAAGAAVVQSVPEPAAAGPLLAAGGLLVSRHRRRRA